MPSWKFEFLIIGALCCVWGIVMMIFLPDSPVTAKGLNEREKRVAVERLRDNQTGIENKHLKWYQVREAFTEYVHHRQRVYEPSVIGLYSDRFISYPANHAPNHSYKTYLFFLLGVVGNIPVRSLVGDYVTACANEHIKRMEELAILEPLLSRASASAPWLRR